MRPGGISGLAAVVGGRRPQLGLDPFLHRFDDALLGTEVVQDQGGRHAGFLGDGPECRPSRPFCRDEPEGRIADPGSRRQVIGRAATVHFFNVSHRTDESATDRSLMSETCLLSERKECLREDGK